MNRNDILDALRQHEAELRRMGVVRLSIFGSIARGEGAGSSDVDLAAVIDPGASLSLLDIVGIQQWLETRLGASIDLVEEPTQRADLQDAINRDRVIAF